MTMPHERTRALRFGHETLVEISASPQVDEASRAAAVALLSSFPAPCEVTEWINTTTSVPAPAAAAIEAAGLLFRAMWRSDSCPAELRESLKFTLRHYPGAGEVLRWVHVIGDRPITAWLLPEDHYR